MAQKTIKKTKPAAKKTVAKKTSVKTVAKKQVKKVVRPSVAPVVPVEQKHECTCGCHCCCHGRRFIGVCIKVIILCMVFFLGCLSAPWFMQKGHHAMMRHIAFDDNGCVVLETVKCPKMLEMLATADDNADGCISRQELKNAVSAMHGPDVK